ncbi:UNVERIFIED_CONTAM: hypothetical protein GTU68_015427 [Idotea baltica]|nr:hypothetical protein [Idotea baltica]
MSTDLLRFLVCGSVDDGKSSLIGRLLYDSKQILDDQYEALERAKTQSGQAEVNLANLTDGLRAEREQGITIDVAYRFFSTEKRRFIVADTPGHIQYTRNMVTGASTARLSIIMIDARKGIISQTRRHAYLSSLLGIKHFVLCVNKMDQVDYAEDKFLEIQNEFNEFIKDFKIKSVKAFPVSALFGDNIVNKSEKTPWFEGSPLLQYLEEIEVRKDLDFTKTRLPIQWVIRPQDEKNRDFRGFSGQIASGNLALGQEIIILPSGERSKIKKILIGEDELESAIAPQSVTVLIEDDIDIGRNHTIVGTETLPFVSKEIEATVCWMHDKPLQVRKKYTIKHIARNSVGMITEVISKKDIENLDDIDSDKLELNEIGKVKIKTASNLIYDDYFKNRRMGAFIIIDQADNMTVGAGMIHEPEVEEITSYNI